MEAVRVIALPFTIALLCGPRARRLLGALSASCATKQQSCPNAGHLCFFLLIHSFYYVQLLNV